MAQLSKALVLTVYHYCGPDGQEVTVVMTDCSLFLTAYEEVANLLG